MRRAYWAVLLGCMVSACSSTEGTLEPATRTTGKPPSSNASDRVATLSMYRSEDASFVGGSVRLHVEARDASGRPVGSAGVTVSSSDPSVAVVSAVTELTIVGVDGERRNDAFIEMLFVGPGTAVLRAALNGRESRLAIQVQALPRLATGATIERFELIEHRDQCAWACPYLVYTPVVEVRTVVGSAPVTIVGLEVTIPGATTGLCSGNFPTVPGTARHLIGVDPYLWSNDVQFVRLDGTPVPDGPATVRVIVREGADSYGMLTASATIRRMVSNPIFPPPSPPTEYWTC
jgi:hypothetical protein